jgi:hypothetical protein
VNLTLDRFGQNEKQRWNQKRDQAYSPEARLEDLDVIPQEIFPSLGDISLQ